MSPLAAFRLVPPLATHSVAIAIVTVSAYLGAAEARPLLLGRPVDPLALAFAVQFGLVLLLNVSQSRTLTLLRRSPVFSALFLLAAVAGIAALVVWGTATVAAMLMIAWALLNALYLTWVPAYHPEGYTSLPTPFRALKAHRAEAALLEAAGIVCVAACLQAAWVLSGPFVFVLVMAPGRLLMRVVTQWIIVLYLISAERRGGG